MGLKEYQVGDLTYQFEEGKQPDGAKPVGARTGRSRQPQNKARDAGTKIADQGTGAPPAADPADTTPPEK